MEYKKLNELCIPFSSNISINKLEHNFGDYPLYGASGLVKHINFFQADKPYISIVKDGAGVGRIALHKAQSSIVGTMIGIYPNENIDILWLYYALKKQNLGKSKTGSTIPHIYFKDYGKNIVKVVPKDEQINISKTLEKIENLISRYKELLNKLNELIKSQFIEMFGKCDNYDLIGNVLNICRGASPRPISNYITSNEDGVNWIKIGDVDENSLYITSTEERITKEGALKSRTVKPGDFILSNSMSFGRPYILAINGCVHDGWLILSDYENTFNPLYLYHAIRDDEVQYQFNGKANGSTVRNLNSELVRNTSIKIPSINQQNKFADFVQQIDKSKFIIQKEINLLNKLLETKMYEYFS